MRGLFKTLDPPEHDKRERRIFGEDQQRARRFLDSVGARDMGLVLINSKRRGGAGGVGAEWPAWCTIASEPRERWEDVALHEVGHAFGLADEYENQDVTVDEPVELERNVARGFSQLPSAWRLLVNVEDPVPTCAIVPTPATGFASDLVGTFQGARYKPDRFRPSPVCRMRVASDDFCLVCCKLIEGRLR